MAQLNLPTRKHAPALPAGGGYHAGSGLATVPHGSSTPSRYADAGRKVFGGVARTARSAATGVQRGVAHAAARQRALAPLDTLGGIMAASVYTGTAAAVNATIDGTEVGQKFLQLTAGWIKPSTAFAFIGALLRGFGLDKRLPRFFRSANTANLRAMVPIKIYEFFYRVPGLISGRLQGAGGAPQLAGVAPAQKTPLAGAPAQVQAAPAAQQRVEAESVPGEETRA